MMYSMESMARKLIAYAAAAVISRLAKYLLLPVRGQTAMDIDAFK